MILTYERFSRFLFLDNRCWYDCPPKQRLHPSNQRQFPRSSGYAEDPATGVAAAALAVSLQFCERQQHAWLLRQRQQRSSHSTMTHEPELLPAQPPLLTSRYKFHQGTAMGHPSVIVVDNVQVVLHEIEEPPQPPAPSLEEEPPDVAQTPVVLPPPELVEYDDEAGDTVIDDFTDDEYEDDDDNDSAANDAVLIPSPDHPARGGVDDTLHRTVRGTVSLTLLGRVEVDQREMVVVDHDDDDDDDDTSRCV
jgi:hypothetical protein